MENQKRPDQSEAPELDEAEPDQLDEAELDETALDLIAGGMSKAENKIQSGITNKKNDIDAAFLRRLR